MIMNNIFTLSIPDNISRMAAIALIRDALSENSGVIMVDLSQVRFPLLRDFFLVMVRKFPKDRLHLVLPTEQSVTLAQSLGLEAELFSQKSSSAHTQESVTTHNMSMMEYLWYEIRRGGNWIKRHTLDFKKQGNNTLYYKKNSLHTTLIVSGLIASVALLLFIFHFAISKTIITITPVITVRPTTANITYRSENFTGSVLEAKTRVALLKKMEFTSEVSQKFKVEAIDPASAMNARGTITIYNELTVPQELKPTTRFVTADGVVYRSLDWIKLPATRTLNGITEMGVTEAEVEADIQDGNGNIIGARGNIPTGTDLKIPGLKFNQEKIYAKAKINFEGGENPKTHILTKEEVAKFESVLAEHLKKQARNNIQTKLDEEKQKTGKDFAMLIADAITVENMQFSIVSGQNIGDATDEVEMKGTAIVKATVFDRKTSIDYLTQIFRANLLSTSNKEYGIQPETLRVSNVVSRSEDGNEIKMTLEMNTATVYDFENPTNEAIRQLKIKIAGDDKKSAFRKLHEETQVEEVEMKNYPFWVSDVTSNVENIDFVIKK